MRKAISITVVMLIVGRLYAQERKLLLEGNALYDQQKFKEAVEVYQKALQKAPSSVPASFNLGNALIQQKQYDEARNVMGNAAKTAKDNTTKGSANYNIGNTYMEEKKWQDAANAYKQALRTNPADTDAKYNLSYALSKLKQQKQEDNKDKKNEKQPKDKDKQQQKNQPQPKENKPEQQPQQSKLSKQQADNLLNMLEGEERKLKDKAQKENGVPARQQKDW